MHLQSLELFGFKSFADRTAFNFHEGVTAIVGPNGCGKSNLLDAVRWVLGEQSAKSLRGNEMADVIFNGTDTRKPLGFAEVSLNFTDCAEELSVDWHEVRVTRRVYRDGNSEYLLNKTPCRLRDIQNLFADTGVARAAYSMMEQGKIDMILSSRPEDRRAVFEEAAGITRYKAQKREALRKLEATEANLLRIGDVIKEVKRQIGSLQRQAGKARRYQALLADLRVLDTHHSRKQLDSLERDLATCRSELERLVESEQTTRAKIGAGENEIAGERRTVDQIDIEIADVRTEVQRLQTEIVTHRSRIEFNRQRAQELNELVERSRKDIAAAEAKRSQQATQIQKADSLIEKTNQVLRTKKDELAELSDLLSKIGAERNAREAMLETLRISLSKNETRIAALEDELSGISARREMTCAQLRQITDDTEIAMAACDKIATQIAAVLATTRTEQQEVESLLAESQAAEENLHRQEELIADAERNLAAIERTIAEKNARLELLRQFNQEGIGLAEGSKAVLQRMDDRFRAAIVGPLVSQLDVDSKFIAAIEAALGRNLHAIVLNDADIVSEIIAKLTRDKLGQAALLLPQLQVPVAPSTRKVLPENALAWAVDKVVTPRLLEPLIRHLLADVVIFSRLEQALDCKKNHPALAMATLAGEFISTEGIVFGGSGNPKSDSLLERKAEIATLEKEQTSLTEQRDALAGKCDEMRTAVKTAAQELHHSRERHQAAHIAQSTSSGKISLFEREKNDIAHKIESLESEKATLEQQVGVAEERIIGLKKELHDARAQLVTQLSEQNAAEIAGKNTSARESDASAKINELRIAIATEHQRQEILTAQRQPMAAREGELAEFIAARRADISAYEGKLATQANESRESHAAIESQSGRCQEAEAKTDLLAGQRATRVSVIGERETELRHLRDSLSQLQDRRGQQQVRESQLQMQIDNLVEHVERRYQVDLRKFAPDQAAFSKTLNVQLKRRSERADAVSESESARASRAIAGALADEGLAGNSIAEQSFGEGAESRTRRRVRSPEDVDLGNEDLQKLIVDLARQLDNMGPVNLDAVQEYDELEERYRFLETQNNDLTNSRRELLDVIARINSTTKKMFAETFAQVRVNFRDIFAELFGGGRSDLSLMDESDPLNCGIEITAKPPGKQLQTISLLSGGERAMTAVALLFAIYMVRPSPFCVLDEIDAPLDESNINRFIRVLERFVKQSQFVIITHNKRTIAKADVLYGVTMEERGVSKVVGLKLVPRDDVDAEVATESSSGNGTQRDFTLEGVESQPSFAAR